jgi:hypothetical protein
VGPRLGLDAVAKRRIMDGERRAHGRDKAYTLVGKLEREKIRNI